MKKPRKRKILLALATVPVALAALALFAYLGAWRRLGRVHQVHTSTLAAPENTDQAAHAASVARGEHLVRARYGCANCHGEDLGGGFMLDEPAMGRWPAPNLTRGRGGLAADFDLQDWERIVRHGVRPDGTAAVMPSQDFAAMSDEELLDIVAYVRSRPAVDRQMPERSFGPVGTLLLALGKLPLSAEQLAGRTEHPARPPQAAPTKAFGAHLAQTCIACHGPGFAGGPIPGGAPDWPPAANLTAHGDGLGAWDEDDFRRLMRTGRRPDGTEVRAPMREVIRLGQAMTDTELRALWAYLRSLPPQPTPR